MKIGVVGCGLIGNRRARVAQGAGDNVLLVADLKPDAARATAAAVRSAWTDDSRAVTSHPQIEAVVVSTVNKSLLPITMAALQSGKHVLCEKPLGRNAQEAKKILDTARSQDRVLKVGFNHPHHPALRWAHELAQAGAIGPLISIRAAYGHGGRPGYGKEWRGDPDLAGGGQLLDQGVHIVDLCRWFLGDFVAVSGATATYFWDLGFFEAGERQGMNNGPRQLEDNAYALLRTSQGQIAQLHTSWTQWKNLFRFEVFGRDGYLSVDGLGGSYGLERLTLGRRRPESGPPDEGTWEYPGPDLSWEAEWREFKSAIHEGREPLGSGHDGYQAARIIDAIYESARTGRTVDLAP